MKRPDGSDAQPSRCQLPTAEQQFVRLLVKLHQAAADVEKGGAGFGQLDAPPAPDDQFHTIAAFQFLHLRGDGWLADIECPRGSRETAMLGNGMEGTEVRKNYSHF